MRWRSFKSSWRSAKFADKQFSRRARELAARQESSGFDISVLPEALGDAFYRLLIVVTAKRHDEDSFGVEAVDQSPHLFFADAREPLKELLRPGSGCER